MATLRIVRCTAASFGGTAITGVVQAGWQVNVMKKRGRSDGEAGDTSIDKTFHRYSGFVEIDMFSDAADGEGQPEELLTGTAGALVITWYAAGGTSKTTTFDNVVFTGTSAARIGEGAEDGNTTRVRVNFLGQFASGDATFASQLAVA